MPRGTYLHNQPLTATYNIHRLVLRFCTDVIKSRDICCRHVGCHAIPGYTGLVHWEPGHVHVWCTTNTKYIGINDIIGHTWVAVSYNSRAGVQEGTRLYLFIDFQRIRTEKQNKWIAAVNTKTETGWGSTGPKPTLMSYGCRVHTSASHFGHNYVKHKGF